MFERGYHCFDTIYFGDRSRIAFPLKLSSRIVDGPVFAIHAVLLFDRQELLGIWRKQGGMSGTQPFSGLIRLC